LGHEVGQTFNVPIYSDADGERRITGDAKFTVTESDGHSATVSSETGGTYTMPRDSVKHFADDLNQKVDVPEHPSNHHINAIREGRAKWLGKGDDGMVFDVGEGRVGKVTTTVPYNLQNHRAHHHAIADARRQAEVTNQAISEGHDILLPQEFEEHGEKGFTFMPKVEIGGQLSSDQIKEYRAKLKAFHDAGWRLNDRIQHGVDADGRIRIFDTGKLTKIDPTSSEAQHDDWGQAKHGRTLMREHGHFDEETHSDNVRDYVDDMREVLEYNDGVEQGERVNPLYPHQWRELDASIDELIANESDELGFHVDDLREALDRIEGQFPRTTPRGPAFTARTNDPNADFWIQRKGGEDTVGTPHKDFRPESIGITVDSEQLLPDYAYYLFQHVQQNLGFWKQRAKGTLNLKNITLRDVKELQQQVGTDEPPVPKGFELIAGLRDKLDKYESETANRVLDNRLLNAQEAFEDMVTDYEQYDEDDLPHGESIDALIQDKNLFAEMIPDISDEELATVAFASYHTGPYRRENSLNIAGFHVGEEELDWKTDSGRTLMRLLDRQAKRGFNQYGKPTRIGEKNYNGIAYEPEQMEPHQYDEWLRNQYPETDSLQSAGFIANDGTLLDLSGDSRDGNRVIDHRDAVMTDEAAERWGLKPDMGRDYSQYHKLMHILENANAIRFDAEAALIDTPKMPTTSQFRTLARYISEVAPSIIYVDFKDENFALYNPTIGKLRRALEDIEEGTFSDPDQYAADETTDTEESLRPTFIQRQGSEQKLQSPSDEGYKTKPQLEQQRESKETLIEPQHLEPYEHVEPEPTKVEPNMDARSQLQKIYSDAFGEEPQDGSGIKQILLRNKEYAEAGQQALFPETSAEYLKSLDNDKISELHRQAYPKPERVNPFADDDYLYHVARADSGSWIQKEGLKPNQSSNFGGGLQHNIRGNVFLTEKSGMPDVLNYLQRNLEASGQWDDESNYDQPIYSKHFKVFRVPKKHIKDYAAIDEVGTRDQQSTAYKVNHVIKERVKNAKQMAGKYQQAMQRSNYEAKNLKEQKNSLDVAKRQQIGKAAREAKKAESQMDALLRQIERKEAPQQYELQFEISAPYEYDDGMGGTEMVRDLDSYFIDKTRANPQGEKKWFDSLVIAAERGNFLDNDQLSDEQKSNALDNYGRHTLSGRYFSLQNVFENLADQRTDPEYMDQLYETQSESWKEFKKRLTFLYRFNNFIGSLDERQKEQAISMQWMDKYRDQLRYTTESLLEFGDIGPYTKRAEEIANSATAAIEEAYTATSTLNDWQEQYGELYDHHLAESARMQLQDMKLKVASNPNYWEWNRDGVALDSDGLPLILFHGTPLGGFGEFANLDVDGHIYSSTDVTMGTSYNNGYYDDATPAFANTVDDVREAVSKSKKLFMEYIEPDGERVSSYLLSNPETGTLAVLSRDELPREIGDDTQIPPKAVISSGNDLELVVGWNKWLHDPSQQRQRGKDIQAKGVYPLVYRLEKPLIIEGNGNLWNDIDLFATSDFDQDYAESYASARELLTQPQLTNWITHAGYNPYPQASMELRSWLFSQNDAEAEQQMEQLGDLNPLDDDFDADDVTDNLVLARIIDEVSEIYGVPAFDILKETVAIPYQLTTRDYAKAAQDAGYDGIIFKDIVDYGGAVEEFDLDFEDYPPADVYVAFQTDQVKSAHNLGYFTRQGPDSRRLLYQAAE